MIAIKIECGCGQHYAFDVDAVDGRMPATVACPTCGADGTEQANAMIARSLPSETAAAASGGARLRLPTIAHEEVSSVPSPSPAQPLLRGMTSFVPVVDRAQAEHEARAKILWGDAPEEVIKFLMLHGVPVEEAPALVAGMYQERTATIRRNGIKKIVIGVLVMLVPVVAYIIFASIGVIPLKLFAATVVVGLWGAWLVLKGLFMAVSPKTEAGDVSEQ